MSEEKIRLNRYLSEAGLCSRREADRLIEAGRISVRRKDTDETERACIGLCLETGDTVLFDGREITAGKRKHHYLLLNKPKGIICTADRNVPENVIDYLHYGSRITYVGRLDKDSTGLLLLTDDGYMNNEMMRAARGHEKEYACRLSKPVTEDFINHMAGGLVIEVPDRDHQMVRRRTRPCRVEKTGDREIRITLTQGYNRQIRRMCEALGQKVLSLKRIRIMNLTLGDLPEGKWRELTEEEISDLKKEVNKHKKESGSEIAGKKYESGRT